MKENIRIYEIRKFVTREEDKERIVFERSEEGKWIYKAPNAQVHTEEQLEIILAKLKELNNEEKHEMS